MTDDIVWIKDRQFVQPAGASYIVSSRSGDKEGQNGGETTINSIISELTVFQLGQQDNDAYVCRAEGTTMQNEDLNWSLIESNITPTQPVILSALYIIKCYMRRRSAFSAILPTVRCDSLPG